MSTRVQKGGQKFKPTTKPKPRLGETSSRHNSIQPDYNVSSAQTSATADNIGNLSSGSQHKTVLHSALEEPNNSSVIGQPVEGSSPTMYDSQTYSGLLLASAEGIIERQSPAITEFAQDEPQDRAAYNMRASSLAAGPSRAIPVVVPSRASQRLGPNPSVPIVLPSRSSDAPHTSSSSDGAMIDVPQTGSDHTLVGVNSNSAEVKGSVFPSNGAVTRPASAFGSGPSKPNKQSEDSHVPKAGILHKRQRTSSLNSVTHIASQGRKLRRKGAGKRRSASAIESSDAYSETEVEEEYNDKSDTSLARRQRQRSVTSSSRRGRPKKAPSLPPFDPDADPGEDLDPTVTTMASICDDTGRGRVSSKAAIILCNHAAWKAESKAKRARMMAVMEAKKYGRKEDGEGELSGAMEAGSGQPPAMDTRVEEVVIEADGHPDANTGGFNYNESMSTNRFNVQIRIGPNGETIVDEESLFVDRAEGAEIETEQYTHVEESDQTKFINSASFSRKSRGSRWNAEETELFYDALSQFGENYELISYILPGRDRKACKNKFKAEDKKNPNRITFCLNNRVPYDMQTLSRMTGKDFSGPTPEIRLPEMPTLAPAPEVHEEPRSERPIRKKSRTPADSGGVQILGDVESYNLDVDDD